MTPLQKRMIGGYALLLHPTTIDNIFVLGGGEWKRRHLTDKRYSGDNRLILPKSSHRRQGLAPRCGLSHPGTGADPKGLAVRQLKRYMSWVQNVARQFGPYLPWALVA